MELRVVQIAADCLGGLCCRRTGFGCAEITEHQLCQSVCLSFIPDAVNVVHAHIHFAGRIVRQIGINDALI